MDKRLQNILVIDIETASQAQSLADMPDEMSSHWQYKSQFIRNEDEQTVDQLFFSRAGIYAEFGKVIVISVGFFYQMEDKQLGLRVKSFYNDDEHVLLAEFKAFLIEKFDPETVRLCAHNGKEFDYPYLCRRMLVNDLAIPEVLNLTGRKPWEVQHIDTMELWKFGDRKNFTSLHLLTSLFGIPSSKSDIDGSRVNEVYYNEKDGLERIAAYCCGDVVATAQLYLRLNNLPQIDSQQITYVNKPLV
ncbi:MAG: putative PolB exonuclease-like 3'-5' exonuclease [Cyclobacteriaceae bacterium]|jgi:predicted PolB exonuclease-like 3'-5' exonuclease